MKGDTMKIRRDSLDTLFAKYVKLRDKHCQRCGGTGGLQTAHFHSRRKQTVRFDESNACLCCFGCHSYLDGNPIEKVQFFKERLGEKEFENLNIRAEFRGTKIDREAIRIYLKELIKEIS